MPNPKNIEPHKMKKGTTLNPNGRPKGVRNRSTIVREILAMKGVIPDEVFKSLKEIFPTLNNKMTIEEVMTISIANKAITESDVNAYKALMDSGYGAPTQQTDHTTAGEKINTIINLGSGIKPNEATE
jgi:hypothetical protein